MFDAINATPDEVACPMAGDDLVPRPDAIMDRAFTVAATPEEVWPWLAQLGKRRAGWYLPRVVERFLPRSRRAARDIRPEFQGLQVGQVIPDYGGPNETFEVAQIDPPKVLVYRSQRGTMAVSWVITLTEGARGHPTVSGASGPGTTHSKGSSRIHLRLRLGPVRHKRLVHTAGELIDLLTVAGMAAGLEERLADGGPVDGT